MPEGKDDMAALVPEIFGVLLMKIFFPDGQGEKAENPDVYEGDDLKENPIFPSPSVHKVQIQNSDIESREMREETNPKYK